MWYLNKKHIPLVFLAIISAWWTFYYQTANWLNDFGASNFEWLYLVDGLIVLPILCFVCLSDKKEAAIKAITYGCLVIFIASFIVPEKNKFVLTYLESGRYLVLITFLLFEIVTIATVILSVKTSLAKGIDPDKAISEPVERLVGKGVVCQILSFETRVWTYALFASRINKGLFEGDKHFAYDKKDGTKSNALGFILLILIELPIVHLLLHFVWSPMAANVITGLTIFGLVFFVAEYRAISIRPVSISNKKITIRYGIFNPFEVELSSIENVMINRSFVARNKNIKRYNLSGNPNVEIKLNNCQIKSVYLGLNKPEVFVKSLQARLARINENK